ncbi:hypothetical protein JL722_9346 [Aureococcus anophagefferens]|nr:hypothetical protein JL722_9346 [Aureococcus anophagefferens]
MVKVSPTWVFMVVAFAALVVVHHSNTHVGLLDARERRHAEEVKRLRAMIDHAQRSADAGGAPAWLAVGLPTVPRADDADYLLQTLASFAAELPRDASDPAHGSVVVFVVNTHGPGHKRFDEASRLYERDAQFRFSAAAEAAPPNEKRDSGSANRPGWRARRPPDHLVVEWFAGETEESRGYRGDRQHLGFRWNFFDHIGARSTLRAQTSGKMPACYEELLAPVVFPVEPPPEAVPEPRLHALRQPPPRQLTSARCAASARGDGARR